MSKRLYQRPDLKGRRQAKAACVLQRAMSFILLKRFPSFCITVSRIVLSADFQHARVFVVSASSDEQIVLLLEEQAYDIGQDIKRQVRLPNLPCFKFFWDDSFDAASTVNSIIKSNG